MTSGARPAYAVFLRGINLARHRRVTNAELRPHFHTLGIPGALTYRTTGNLAISPLTGSVPDAAADTDRTRSGLEQILGHPVGVYLRTAAQMRAITACEPFPRSRAEASQGRIQTLLLHEPTTRATRDRVLRLATEDDLLAFGDNELYWLPLAGDASPALWSSPRKSTIDFNAVDKLLGPTTMRTKNLIEQMTAKYFTT